MMLPKVPQFVTPAKAGVHTHLSFLDSGFRRNDGHGLYFFLSKLFLFYVKTNKAVVLLFSEELVSGPFGPTGEIVPSSRVGAQNFQDLPGF